jgi:hypothetical protein
VHVLSSAPCFTLRASGNIANHDDNAGRNVRSLERAWSNMVEHATTFCVPSRLTSSEVCLSAWSRSGSRSRFVGLSGRPVARGIAWRCHVQHLTQQSTLLLMISANRMLGHIEHRRPPQVRGSKESRLDCPTLQTLRGPADSDFSCQRRTIVAGSISKEYMAASKWTSHIHLLRWVDRR